MVLAAGTVDGVTYTLPLAVLDVVPVVLSVAAYALLARLAGEHGRRALLAARAGVILIAIGGGAKAVWKLLVAAARWDVARLDDLLFPCLALGFVLLWQALRGRPARGVLVAGVVALSALVLASAAGVAAAAVELLVVMTLGSLAVALDVVRRARARREGVAVLLVAVNVVAVLGLAGLARLEQTAVLQWIEELTNVAAQGSLLLAVVIVGGVRGRGGRRSQPAVDRPVVGSVR